jgi:hypothetical protein
MVRAPELKNADILANVSRQGIEFNSASSEQPSDKRFEYIENLQKIIWTAFGSKLGQKPQNWTGQFFLLKVGYVDKKFLNLFFVLLLVPNTGATGIYTCIIELESPFFSESFGRNKLFGLNQVIKNLLNFPSFFYVLTKTNLFLFKKFIKWS